MLGLHPAPTTVTQNQQYLPYHQNLARQAQNSNSVDNKRSNSQYKKARFRDANQESVKDFQKVLRSTSQIEISGSHILNDGLNSMVNLPKIKQILIKKYLDKNPEDTLKLLEQQQTKRNQQLQSNQQLKQSDTEESYNIPGVNPGTFYSQFNYNVLHSQIANTRQPTVIKTNQTKMYLSQENTFWDEILQGETQKTDLDPLLRKTMFNAVGYRNLKMPTKVEFPTKVDVLQNFKIKYTSQLSQTKLNRQGESTPLLYESHSQDDTNFNFKRKVDPNLQLNKIVTQSRNQTTEDSMLVSKIQKIRDESTELSNFDSQQRQNPSQDLEINSTIFQSVIQGGHVAQSQKVQKKQLNTDLDFSQKEGLKAQLARQTKPLLKAEITEKLQIAYAENAGVEESIFKRETALKNRNKNIRALSARAKERILAQKLNKQCLQDDSEGSECTDHVDPASYNLAREQNRTKVFQATLKQSMLPRLTDLNMKDHVESFINVMEQANLIHGQDKTCGDDQQIVNETYQRYIEQLQRQQAIKYNTPKSEVPEQPYEVRPETTDSQPKMELALDMYQLLLKLKLNQQESDKMLAKINTREYITKLYHADIKSRKQNEFDTDMFERDQIILALTLISKNNLKQSKLNYIDDLDYVNDYAMLLQDDCGEVGKIKTAQPQLVSKVRPKIQRGFLIFPGEKSANIEDYDYTELVDDPEKVFDDYLERSTEAKKVIGEEIQNRYADRITSQNYNMNSTLFDMSSTRVQFIKTATHNSDLALPLLSKIKNQELNLVNYSLQSAHLLALTSVFEIDPQILKAITLINCGIDDSSLTILLDGCQKLANLTVISITKGEVGLNSVKALKLLVQKSEGLQKLKFKDVKIQPLVAEALFSMLGQRCSLKSLSLVNFQFTENTFALFTNYFEKTQRLEELDISHATGLRPFWFINFMKVLSQNKSLRSLNLAGNNFIESQFHARKQLENPYKIFKILMERWKRMGPGQKFPAHLVVNGQLAVAKKKKVENQSPSGKPNVEIPKFKEFDEVDYLLKRNSTSLKTERDDDRYGNRNLKKFITSKKNIEFENITQQEGSANYMTRETFEQFKIAAKLEAEMEDLLKDEEVSELAMAATEAIYKLLRRNAVIQHLDISDCNLTQVMCARIALGVKCSRTMMGFHLSGNPGVTPALKQYLLFKMKGFDPLDEPVSEINNNFIEEDQNLSQQLHAQLQIDFGEQSLAHETVTIRNQTMKGLCMKQELPHDHSKQMTQTLVFTRLIAHRKEIPNSGKWKMLTQQQQECWICSNHTLTYFFWNAKSINNSQIPDHMIQKERLTHKLGVQTQDTVPIIWGNFTNWKPQRMIPVKDFVTLYRLKTPPSFLKMLIRAKNLDSSKVTLFRELDHQCKLLYYDLENNYANENIVNWRRHMGTTLRFTQPCLAGMEHYSNIDDYNSEYTMSSHTPMFIFPALVRPGKHYFLVKEHQEIRRRDSQKTESAYLSEPPGSVMQSIDAFQSNFFKQGLRQCENDFIDGSDSKFSLFKQIIPLREERLPALSKNMIAQVVERQFQKHVSVFKAWKKDTPSILRESFDLDWAQIKLEKLCPKEEEQVKLQNIVRKHYAYLKNIHIDLLCTNDIPFVNVMDFFPFSQKCQFSDKILTQANIDLIFVQCDSYYPQVKNNIKRAHFFEVLIRIAKQKLFDQQMFKNLDKAFDHLVQNLIKKNYGVADKWHKVRQDVFWTIPTNDLLFANIDGLKKVYSFYLQREKKWMDKSEAMDIMTKQFDDFSVNQVVARRCYTMSKMTVIDEINTFEKHIRMTFVEFLEMICRIAYNHFDDTDKKDLPWIKKLEIVVDQVLGMREIERKEPIIMTVIDSDCDISDDEY